MMFHASAYMATTAATAGLSKIPAVVDGYVDVTDGGIVFPDPVKLITWHGFRATADGRRFQLQCEAWRDNGFPSLIPAIGQNSVGTLNIIKPFIEKPAMFNVPSGLPVYAFYDNPGNAFNTALVLFTGDNNRSFANGNITTLQFTGAISGVASLWGRGQMVPEQTLPAGRYQVVGMDVFSVSQNAIASRLRFNNQLTGPGVPINTSVTSTFPEYFRYGNMGVFGEFEHNQIPAIEALIITTGNEIELVNLDVIKIR